MIQEQTPLYRPSIKLFFILFFTTGAILSGLLTFFYQKETRDLTHFIKIQESYGLELRKKRISSIFKDIKADIFFLRDQNELRQYLRTEKKQQLTLMGQEYISLAKSTRMYDQIRYIDKQGMEILRVNFNQGEPLIVPDDQLQSKADRYYYKECVSLKKDEVFVSPFDLNVEHGTVEQPFKPMIRLCTPVFDNHGTERGVLVLNFLGQDILTSLLSIERVSLGQTMLVNNQGYWLRHPDPAYEWGFMFQDKADVSLAIQSPEVWKEIQSSAKEQIGTPEGLYSFNTVLPMLDEAEPSQYASPAKGTIGQYRWHLISFLPQQKIDQKSHAIFMQFLILGAVLFILTAIGSWSMAYAVTKRKIAQNRLKTMAYFDTLTNLPNRRHFFDRLEEAVSHGNRYNNTLALMYVDLDGFKNINDSLGHDAGDTLLQHVAYCLRKTCRKSDTVSRLGGDEFAILIPEVASQEDIATIAAKIIAILSQPITINNAQAQVGASIGITLFPADGDEVSQLLSNADSAMYLAKSQGKNQYLFFSDTQPPKN
ncbi:sensor domain-containing diguanylate cyclase [Desulfogranum marinum]|uniref:sensor domain-containing diguanylate cyclase n=1 Tax=Desulfogranum marinum TaxID=453220 RepID=UPI0019627617|nr:sensor domain-containing diguanylate cyclase [Desulfogranum marinum]MBM9513530.1 GGDEF domain-containing protein [Desulfogranum marinum]